MLAVLASMTCTATADASKIRWIAGMPPAWADKPYTGNLAIQRFHTKDKIPCNDNKVACAYTPAPDSTTLVGGPHPWCYLMIGNDKLLVAENPNYTYAAVLRHELGHCNGWPGDHPNTRAIGPEKIKMPKLPANILYLPPDDINKVCWSFNGGGVRVCEPIDTWVVCMVPNEGMKFCKRVRS